MRPYDKEKEAKILDSAAKVLVKDGFSAVTISKIAKESNIAVGTVYIYFADKDELLRNLFLDRNARVAKIVTDIDINSENLPHELEKLMDRVYEYGKEHLEDLVVIREFNKISMLKRFNVTQEQAYKDYQKLEEFTRAGIDKNIFYEESYQLLMSFAYIPAVEYLLAVANNTLDPTEVPFDKVKKMSMRAIVK